MPNSDVLDFTLSNARRFYPSKGDPLGTKGLTKSNADSKISKYSHRREQLQNNNEQINQDHLDRAAAREPRSRSTHVLLSVPLMYQNPSDLGFVNKETQNLFCI